MSYIIKSKDGSPLLFQGKEVAGLDSIGVVKSVDLKSRILNITGTDETVDRDGDIVAVSGWVLDYYLKNPVFLWSHDYHSVPLGAAMSVKKKKNPARLDFQIRFPRVGLYPFADMILELYDEKIINASSVGFIPYTWDELDEKNSGDRPTSYFGGRRFTKQELLELSGCAVPSNPSALQNSLKSMQNINWASPEDLVSYISGKSVPVIENKDDVLEELDLKCFFVDETEPKIHQVSEEIVSEVKEEDKESKGVCGSKSLPIDSSEDWDGAAARASIFSWANGDWGKYKKGFVYQDPNVNPETKGAYKMPFAKVVGGTLKAVWGGVSAAMGAVNGARGGADLGSDKKACYNFLKGYYKKFDKEPPVFNEGLESEILTFEDEIFNLIKEECKEVIIRYTLNEEDEVTKEFVDLKDLEPEEKIGAVLSQKNRSKLEQAKTILEELLADSETPVEEPVQEEAVKEEVQAETTQEDLSLLLPVVASLKTLTLKLTQFGG